MNFFYLLLALFPSFIHVNIRRLLGQKIGKGVKIKFGSIILAENIILGANVKIGPFCLIRAKTLNLKRNVEIKPLVLISTKNVHFGEFVHIAPTAIIRSEFTKESSITIDDHSRIFPFCWLDTGEGISIGKSVGVGGHSLIFTHGSWPDYIDGGPVNFGKVTIEDNVWLPWRVFILPGVTIGKNTVIGANSLINKSLAPNVLAAGSPAKIIKENFWKEIDEQEKITRVDTLLNEYVKYINDKKGNLNATYSDGKVQNGTFVIKVNNKENLKEGDLLLLINMKLPDQDFNYLTDSKINILNHNTKTIYINKQNDEILVFIKFIRRFGVRLYINY